MKDIISNLINGKSVLILGFGREGRSTYKLLKKLGNYSKIGIADMNPVADADDAVTHCGEDYLDYIDEYDITFKSPGIVLPKRYNEYKGRVTSQTEIFLQAYGKQVIGVTGTKGKSTVSSLIYHMLHTNNVPSLFAGNIGTPVFEIVDDIKQNTVVVLELSCHQLEICRYSPYVSVLLNIYEDHLDHYGTMENYINAKKNIYLNQPSLGMVYFSKLFVPPAEEISSRYKVVDKSILPFVSLEDIDGVKLRGEHNLTNCAFVYEIAKTFGISDDAFIESLKSFTPLHHRLELIGTKNGVQYFDDSISTTVESTINAVKSISNAHTLLVGGMDRGINYDNLVEYLAGCKLKSIICMYSSGKRIYDMLSSCDNVKPDLIYCDDLKAAVDKAQEVTASGGACILSPAAASYGYFKNFEERGDAYKAMLFD